MLIISNTPVLKVLLYMLLGMLSSFGGYPELGTCGEIKANKTKKCIDIK
jgi:hypothetical protein